MLTNETSINIGELLDPLSDYVSGLPTPQQKAMAEYFSARSTAGSSNSMSATKPVSPSIPYAFPLAQGPNVVGPVKLTPQYETAPPRRASPIPFEPSVEEIQPTPSTSISMPMMSPLSTNATRGPPTPVTASRRTAEYFPDVRVTSVPLDETSIVTLGSPRTPSTALSPTSTVIAESNSGSNPSTFLPSPTTPLDPARSPGSLLDPHSPASTLSDKTAIAPADGPAYCDVPILGSSQEANGARTPTSLRGGSYSSHHSTAASGSSSGSSGHLDGPPSVSSTSGSTHALTMTREEAMFNELNYLTAPFPPNELGRVTALHK